MKKWISENLKTSRGWFSVPYTKHPPKREVDLHYNSLSPTENAKKVDEYLEALEWALSNRNKIKNIAVAGPYGSGKSSVIKTFQNQHKHNSDYKFLNISLATFEEEKNNTNRENKDNLLRLIELSILQQLFYHEKDDKIPYSRFKKIKNHKNKDLCIMSLCSLIFVVAFIYLIFPDFFSKFSIFELTSKWNDLIRPLAVIFVLIITFCMMFKIIKTLMGITIKKFGISNASIEIDDKISKSILNNHLDEILYFFEVTEYNTIIIEDLDRFKRTDVFTKLREINLLINNSKKIKPDVVFIYAIRDDMFQDKDRTKFFDFMIPIIPVINYSNSNEKLLELIKKNGYNISKDLIEDISLFIDDMRLLYNVMNEYYIYSEKLNDRLNQDKLLSMIVYKNIYPNDFTKLSQNEGELFNIIVTKKHEYIHEETSKVSDEIVEIKNKIEMSENVKLNNVEELRTVYLSKIIEKIKLANPSYPFSVFYVDDKNISMSQAMESNNFHSIINSKSIRYKDYHGRPQNIKLDFATIEDEINSRQTYKEREDLILSSDEIEELKNKIEKLERKRNEIKKYKIKMLVFDKSIDIDSDKYTNTSLDNSTDTNPQNKNQRPFINILLRNGYIDEDYFDYISIFYEGSLSKNDHQFLINVKTQKDTEFDYPLQQRRNLLKKIAELEFEKEYILNYSLLDYLIESSEFSTKTKKYFTLLSTESDSVIEFIDSHISRTTNIDKFIEYLCRNWINIWGFIANKSSYSKEKMEKYFKLIIEYAETKDIKEIFVDSKCKISDNKDFLLVIQNTDKLKEIIKELDIKFSILNESAPKELLDYVYGNNNYSLNIQNVKFFLRNEKLLDEITFKTRNYTTIKQSGLEELINYSHFGVRFC